MRTKFLPRILIAGLLTFIGASLHAESEQELITLLQSTASATKKCDACRQLRTLATAQSVPALAALLMDERISHAACYALEGIREPEAGDALREALAKTSGLTKAGVIDSLGRRRDVKSLPMLQPLVGDADPSIAVAAATALGRIGGEKAVVTLTAARGMSPPPVQAALANALLQCAEQLLAQGERGRASAIYQSCLDAGVPPQIRLAAWRGYVIANPDRRVKLMTDALVGNDRVTHPAALQLVRELGEDKVIKACVKRWKDLPADSQVALLDASLKLREKALPTVRAAIGSSNLLVRVTAWQTLANLEDSSLLPALAQAAASGEPAERDAARETLTRLRGSGVEKAIRKQIQKGNPPVQAELLRALGDRGDRDAADVLLKYAGNTNESVRLAALRSLRILAVENTLAPLLDLASQAKSERERAPVLEALSALCQASTDKDQTTRRVLDALNRLPLAERRHLLPLLIELGTPAALAATAEASRSSDPALAKEGIRVLTQWPNATAAPVLIELARTGTDATLQLLALSGCITVAEQETNLTRRFEILQQAMATAKRPAEKRQALGQLGQIPTTAALQIAMDEIADPELSNEAGLAAVSIAEKLAAAHPKLAAETATKVLAHSQSANVLKRAWALRPQTKINAPFIQDWLVCGPYHAAGAIGAPALFDIAFAPEKPDKTVTWKPLPRTDSANLMTIFPDQVNCAAYLKAQIVAPRDCRAVLLLGSDDGVKAWLNGAVVHGANVDRGMVPDQDAALIELKPGTNELQLKITQGAGGWSACARIVGTDGQPVPGLSVVPQGGTEAHAAAPAASKPEPVPALLPKRDAFRTQRLSDLFYAEGAAGGDFNQDGKLDVVAGPFWWEGPDFSKRHEYRPVKNYDPREYSDNFLTFTGDYNGDGRTDILCIPFPGKEGYWYENPGDKTGPWTPHRYYAMVGNESPGMADMNGDGRPDLIFNNEGYLGYATGDPTRPDAEWTFHAVSPQDKRYQRFTHGVGAGDINGDGRMDLLEAVGWWEQPADAQSGKAWTFHPQQFAEAASQMLVTDVDGDGRSDVICAWHCHLFGLLWWRQQRGADGKIEWQRHEILSPNPDVTVNQFRFSQPHAMVLADMNGDGLPDLVTGKRFWAHGPTGDVEPNAPAVLCWFQLQRDSNGEVRFIPHLIDDDSGVGTQVTVADLNADRRPDVIVGNKKGVFVHLNELPR